MTNTVMNESQRRNDLDFFQLNNPLTFYKDAVISLLGNLSQGNDPCLPGKPWPIFPDPNFLLILYDCDLLYVDYCINWGII